MSIEFCTKQNRNEADEQKDSPRSEDDESQLCGNILNRSNLLKLHSSKVVAKVAVKRPASVPLLKNFTKLRRNHYAPVISPISELALNLTETTLGTPTTSRRTVEENGEIKAIECSDKEVKESYSSQSSGDETSQESSLISNNFTLNANNRNALQSHHADSRSHFVRRPLNELLDAAGNSNYYEDTLYEKTHHDMMPIDEVSFYSSASPRSSSPQPCPSVADVAYLPPEGSPQRFTVVHDTVTIVDNDRLRDGSDRAIESKFAFVKPLPPKSTEDRSPPKYGAGGGGHTRSQTRKSPNFRIFNSLSSGSTESMDDDYMALSDMEPLEDEANFPTDLNSLISGDIKNVKTTPETKRPLVRRFCSMTDTTTVRFRGRSLMFESKTPPEVLKSIDENSPRSTVISERCFKRPEPPTTNSSPVQSKRYKLDLDEKENLIINSSKFQNELIVRPILRKSVSMNDADIMSALARSSSEPDLIGDFSKPFCLPLMDGRHQDLKSISAETMAKLIRGEFRESVASFHIIDCRYPYEFDGGHIRGARNLYTHEQILEELVNCKTELPTVQADGPKRHILVFHCEFSSERGPKLSRFLRNNDRQRNTNTYPALHYPEIYLLHGGYKDFYEKFSELCDPIAYCPMLHPSYADHYRQCRAKSKSLGDLKASSVITNRLMKSRSRLVL